MASKSTLKIASQLLDRFFRDAEGRTNRQIDVYFALEDLGVPADKATPALDYLKSRGLLNLFGTDIGFLTEKGIQVVVEETDLSTLAKESKSFIQKPVAQEPVVASPSAEARAPNTPRGSPRPKRAQLTHIDLEGAEFTLPLAQCCRVGRADDNEVRINDKRASKHHAEIVFDKGRYLLVDLESANGTLLNGDYALEPIELKHDDEVVIGRTMLLYQAPEVVAAPAPEPKPAKAEEPSTVISGGRAQGPTERPAPSVSKPAPTPSIRVVKGTPAAPPSGEQPAVPRASSADLFAEPPTAAPSSDLFAEPATAAPGAGLFAATPAPAPAPAAPSDSLFDDDPPTQVPDRPTGPPSGDLFGDRPTAAAAASEDLFEDVGPSAPPPALQADDLFADEPVVKPVATASVPAPAKDDLFADGPPSSATPLPAIDPGLDLELEPLAVSATLAPPPADPIGGADTIAQAPADTATPANPDVEDLWEGDVTPTSGVPDHEKTVDTPRTKDDAATLMMDRESLLSEVEIIEDLPPWTSDTDSEAAHPPYSDPSEMPREPEPELAPAPTEAALEGEDLPEASPSLVLEVAPRPQDGLPQGIVTAEAESDGLEKTADAHEPHPEFYALLSSLKRHAREAELPDRGALIEAIERLESHPYVRLALREL